MLLGDAWHWISAVGSKRGLKGTEKIVRRELLDWGTLAAPGRQAEAQGLGRGADHPGLAARCTSGS